MTVSSGIGGDGGREEGPSLYYNPTRRQLGWEPSSEFLNGVSPDIVTTPFKP